MRSGQTTLPPFVIPISPTQLMRFLVHVKHQTGYMGRWVVLDMAIGQCCGLWTNEQSSRFVVGAVGATGEPLDECCCCRFYQRSPRLLAVQGCLM